MYQREVVLYTRSHSLSGWLTARLLRHIGCYFEIIDPRSVPELLVELSKAAQHKASLPYVFVDHRPVGGAGVVRGLVRSGQFNHLLRDRL
jgi:glutaredoxin-related protein